METCKYMLKSKLMVINTQITENFHVFQLIIIFLEPYPFILLPFYTLFIQLFTLDTLLFSFQFFHFNFFIIISNKLYLR